MASITPIVRIVDPEKPGDYIVINEMDFDPAVHEMYSPGSREGGEPQAEAAPVREFGSKQAQKLAEENGLSANDIPGTGQNGDILLRDVRAVLAK